MSKTSIEWTDETWNPIRGTIGRWHCTHVSEGCRNCYAERINKRWGGPDYKPGADTFRLDEKILEQPLHWRQPRKVFPFDMTDMFHEEIPSEFIEQVWAVMAAADWHIYQILTKRPERMYRFLVEEDHWDQIGKLVVQHSPFSAKRALDRKERGERIFQHVWLGVSVEDQQTADERIPLLLQTPAAVRFVSYEPALGPVNFTQRWLTGYSEDKNVITWIPSPHLNWLIIGGESGPNARPCDLNWVRRVVKELRQHNVACFVKQLGAKPYELGQSKSPFCGCREADCPHVGFAPMEFLKLKHPMGGDPSEWPKDLRVREWPT